MTKKILSIISLAILFYLIAMPVSWHYKTLMVHPDEAKSALARDFKINVDSISEVKYYPFQYRAEIKLVNNKAYEQFLTTLPRNMHFDKRNETFHGWSDLGDYYFYDNDSDIEENWLEVYKDKNLLVYYRRNWDYDKNPWFRYHSIF